MSKNRALILILFSLELAVLVPLGIALLPKTNTTRHIDINARRFGYAPPRIIVNKGDPVSLRFYSTDVTHGFQLDGYAVDLIARKGVTFQRKVRHAAKGHLKIDWQRVSSVRFVANRAGKFIFRCTETCGNLHPFMTGELIVRPNMAYHFFISLSIWLVLGTFMWVRFKNPAGSNRIKRINLLEKFPWLKRLVMRRSFQFWFILPNFIVFYLFILSSLWGSPVGNRNIAIVFVWILWWFILKAVMVPLGGRLWCLMCPLPAPAEWISRKSLTAVHYLKTPIRRLHHRYLGFQKDWPKKFRNIWIQNILFLALISFGMILITRPLATAIVFIIILAGTLILAMLFRHRVFCMYLCPVGGFLGAYSMASMTEVRSVDPKVCIKHKEKSCYSGGPEGWACSWNQYVGNMSRNNYCGLCTECIKSCPKDNVGLFIRPFGSDRKLKGYDEMFNVMIMLVVAVAFSVVMLGPWGFIKDAANVTETKQIIPFLIYLAIIWGSALLVVPGLFILIGKGANRLSGKKVDDRTMTLQVAYVLIPVGIFAWIAFSLPAIMVNYGYIISVFSDPLGLGWDLLGTADRHFKAFIPEWIPVIQGLALLSGLYLGLSRCFMGLKTLIPDRNSQIRAMVFPSVFALLAVNLLLKLYMG
ncbi:MAG: 4Fe-4S binding protein [Desulfobacterales bacterium]|nr:4Fe-4S binding protein [Deltaproteobacteria bacterium]NNL74853.1 4Fe-4S binding protein [Desulfobacterales bacterium]